MTTLVSLTERRRLSKSSDDVAGSSERDDERLREDTCGSKRDEERVRGAERNHSLCGEVMTSRIRSEGG